MNVPSDCPPATRLARFLPLAGILFAALTVAGYLLMGKNPEPDASISTVTEYWGSHHAHVYTAGYILAYGSVFFAIFAIAIWSRIGRATIHSVVGGVALVGAAVATAGLLSQAMVYFALGDLAAKQTTLPGTIQTLNVLGAELSYPIAGGIELLLLAVALAGIARSRAFPRWLSWSALVLGLLQLTPIGFTAFLVFLLWSVAAGIALVVRPTPHPV